MFKSARHQAQLMLLFVLIAITILSGQYWKYYFILPLSAFMLYLSDIMFMGYNEFMFEPNYQAWAEANTEDY
jgi:uncharacterized membrane protein